MAFGGQHVKETGLNGDYLNAWSSLPVIHLRFDNGRIKEEEFHTLISKPIESYESYFRSNSTTKQAEAIIADAKPEAKNQLDQLVDEYNSLSFEVKSQKETLEIYMERASQIIRGKP